MSAVSKLKEMSVSLSSPPPEIKFVTKDSTDFKPEEGRNSEDHNSETHKSGELKSENPKFEEFKSENPKFEELKSEDHKSEDCKNEDRKSEIPKFEDRKSKDHTSETLNSEDTSEHNTSEGHKTQNFNSEDKLPVNSTQEDQKSNAPVLSIPSFYVANTPAKQILENKSRETPTEIPIPSADPRLAAREATLEIQHSDDKSFQSSSPPASGDDRGNESLSDYEQGNSSRNSQSSFLSIQGRSVRDAPRKRRRTTPHELEVLEAEFSRNNRPGKNDRERIAKLTSMDEKAVQVWFQNKRQSHRRQHNLVTPAAVRTQSMPIFQDENSYMGVTPTQPLMYPFGATPTSSMHAMFQPGSNTTNANSQNSHHLITGDAKDKTNDIFSRSTAKFRMGNQVVYGSPPGPKGPKSLKLSMSADGKAELVERSPLKQLSTNNTNIMSAFSGYPVFPASMAAPHAATRFASTPAYPHFQTQHQPPVTGIEQECASSLMVLKFGKWN